jgi:hypothetical protein
VISMLTLQEPGADPVEVPPLSAGGASFTVAGGQTVSLAVNWPADSVENYPAWDVLQRTIVYHNEAIRVSWYVTAGSLEHDITGRSESETETFAQNNWTPGAPSPVHLWVVLHDSRGGTDFAAYDLNVTP